jgi:hypothetical protein
MDMKADANVRSQIRNYVTQRLRMRGDGAAVGDEDLLSRAAASTRSMPLRSSCAIETEYGINFAAINFDLTRLDSITAIVDLVNRHPR